jgi:acyl carrier protein
VNRKRIEAAFPLSPQQKGMLYASLGEQEGGLFVEQFSCRITGSLDIKLFREAWQKLIDSHSMLRTAFVWKAQKEPIQVALKEVEVKLQRHDLRSFSSAEKQLRIEAFLGLDSQQPFNLTEAPLMRLALLQLEDQEYHFVWTIHHILIDGWCRPILLQQLQKAYRSLAAGCPDAIESTRPYRDYVAWLQKQDLAAAEAFWRSQLSGFDGPTGLGRTADTPAMPEELSGSAIADSHVAEPVLCAVQEHAKKHGITLNTVLQGVWAVALARYSGSKDVVFGTTVSGRPAELDGAGNIIGLFINTLPFRVEVASEAPVLEWMKQLQEKHMQIRHYEHCSAGQIHEWSGAPRNRPLYESILVFQNYPSVIAAFALTDEIEIREMRATGARTECPLTLLAGRPGNNGMGLRAVYDRARLSTEAVYLILRHAGVLLTALARDPQQRVAALLELIPDSEIPEVFPRFGAQPLETEFVAPRNEIEQILAAIWAECLGMPETSVTANFFELGGHSLAAVQLINAVSSRLGVRVALSHFFGSPTVAGMASAVVQQIAASAAPEAVAQALNELESGV